VLAACFSGHSWSCYSLLPGDLFQCFVDPILPARTGFLEVFENIPIDAKRDQLFGIRDGWLPRHGLQRLRGRLLECRFRCLPRVHGSSYSIVSHFDHPLDREVSEQFSYAGWAQRTS